MKTSILQNCSIRKLLHPYFLRYADQLDQFSDKNEVIAFLNMDKLKEGKLKWALRQNNKTNKELAFLCGIKIRRFQQLNAEYRRTGRIPMLNLNRRPRTDLSAEEQNIIRKAASESRLSGAVILRLHIRKRYKRTLPYGKIHKFLLKEGISEHDPKKQKQRKYCRYERSHSFSLGHMDFHDSRAMPGKYVITWEDDASRLILAGGEFDAETTENAIKIVNEAKKKAWKEFSAVLHSLNTDKGSQFYANKRDKKGRRGTAEFEKFLKREGIMHIPSRRNHPQTNGKNERWFRTYEENRMKFGSFEEFIVWYNDRIHLGLSRIEGITPNEAMINKLRIENLIGLFLRRIE